MMAGARVKDLIKEYVELVWNKCDIASLSRLTTPDFKYHLGQQPPRSRDAMQAFLESTHEAYPDWQVRILEIIAEEQSGAIRWEGQVTHKGQFHGIAPTGRAIQVNGINMYRIEGDLIAEEWEQTDSLSMLRQLGELPQV
jgi:steroid delta-isomerase-like uncharacterized protein